MTDAASANPFAPSNGVAQRPALPAVLKDEYGRVVYERPHPHPFERQILERLDAIAQRGRDLPEQRIAAEIIRSQNELARAIGQVAQAVKLLGDHLDAVEKRQETALRQLAQQVGAIAYVQGHAPPVVEAPPAAGALPPRVQIVPRMEIIPPPTVSAEVVTGAPPPPEKPNAKRKIHQKDVQQALDYFLSGEVETWEALGAALGVTGSAIRDRCKVLAKQQNKIARLGAITRERQVKRLQAVKARRWQARHA